MNQWRYVTVTSGMTVLAVYFAKESFVREGTLTLRCVAELDGFWQARDSSIIDMSLQIDRVLGPGIIVRTLFQGQSVGLSSEEESRIAEIFKNTI